MTMTNGMTNGQPAAALADVVRVVPPATVGAVQVRLAVLLADLRALAAELRAAGIDTGSYDALRRGLSATEWYTLLAALHAKEKLARKGVWVERPDFDAEPPDRPAREAA